MGEQWGLSVKLFGKTILVVPTSKGADSAQVTSDELLKDAELTSPLARCTETEEEIAGKSESESPDLETGILRGGGENGTDDEDVEEFLQLPQQEVNGSEDGDEEAQKKEAAVAETTESNDDEKEENDDDKKKTTTTVGDKKKAAVAEKPDKNKVLPCPRCKSEDTKFCYYNNYNVNQPRHFCRNCQRYWTAGGTMRNVPVGAGRRKSKSIVAADANNALYVFMLRHLQQQQLQNGYITTEAAALHQPSMHTNKASTVLSFSPDAPVAGVTTLGHVNFHSQTAPGMVLVYSPPAGGDSTPPPTRTASVPTNQTFPSCFNNFTKDQKPGQQLYYHNQGTMNVPHPPPNRTCASKYEPWLPSPTSPADLVPLRQRPMHLGKHMRDDENNVNGDVKQRRHEEEEKRSIWVPKALRITDTPDAAASSSIWTTISASGLGFNKKDQNHCGKMAPSAAMERGFFNAFDTKEKQVAPSTTRTINNRDALLSVNPAAVARSHQFQETA